jgi:hypothetical protein
MIEQPVPPSTLSMLGLVRHLAEVERSWFRRAVGREHVERLYYLKGESPDACFDDLEPGTAEADLAQLTAEWDAARRAVAGASLDDTVTVGSGRERSLRWIYIHMIEEYARHNGHADLIRQRLDGATGA